MKTTTLILLVFLMASPAFSGDAAKGATTTRKWCAEFHDITGANTSDNVPGWRHIANDPQRTPETLPNFLTHPHCEML